MDGISFQDLCDGLCESLGVASCEPRADEEGLVGFHAVVNGVTVDVLHAPRASPGLAYIVVDCGVLLTCDAPALLDANFLPLQLNAASFGRNPQTGGAVLQLPYPFHGGSPAGFVALVRRCAAIALEWRNRRELPDAVATRSMERPNQSFFLNQRV